MEIKSISQRNQEHRNKVAWEIRQFRTFLMAGNAYKGANKEYARIHLKKLKQEFVVLPHGLRVKQLKQVMKIAHQNANYWRNKDGSRMSCGEQDHAVQIEKDYRDNARRAKSILRGR